MPHERATCPWPGDAAALPHQKLQCSKPQFGYIDSSEITNYLPHLPQSTVTSLFPLTKLGGSWWGGAVGWLVVFTHGVRGGRKKQKEKRSTTCFPGPQVSRIFSHCNHSCRGIPASQCLFFIKSPLYTLESQNSLSWKRP